MIKIKNWSSYQSYKDRKPPWIRFHKTMLDNYDYHIMSASARALLPMLWLLASEDKDPVSGCIRDSYERITFRLRMDLKTFKSAICEIEKAGFVFVFDDVQHIENIECNETVTKPYIDSNETVTPETETETETERGGEPLIDDAVYFYNHMAEKTGLPKAMKITKARKSKIVARLKDCDGIEGWKAAIEKLGNSEFCQGKNDRGWKADFDFLLKESSFVKLMEGKYDNVKGIASKTDRVKEAIARANSGIGRMQ